MMGIVTVREHAGVGFPNISASDANLRDDWSRVMLLIAWLFLPHLAGVFKMLRTSFGYRPSMSPAQFLAPGRGISVR